MDSKHIEELLGRYWRCETSLEEEEALRDFFNSDEVPDSLQRYKDLFVYQRMQQEARLGEDFNARILARIEEPPVVKARRMTLSARFAPLLKAAAAVAIVLSVGGIMQHSFLADVKEVPAADTIGKQISAPSVALSKTHGQSCLDSLQQVSRQEEQTK